MGYSHGFWAPTYTSWAKICPKRWIHYFPSICTINSHSQYATKIGKAASPRLSNPEASSVVFDCTGESGTLWYFLDKIFYNCLLHLSFAILLGTRLGVTMRVTTKLVEISPTRTELNCSRKLSRHFLPTIYTLWDERPIAICSGADISPTIPRDIHEPRPSPSA